MENEFLHKITHKTKEIEEFLFFLFLYSRPDLVDLINLKDELTQKIICDQYKLSEEYITKNDLKSRYLIVENNQFIGKLYLRHNEDCDELVSISILPEFRNLGIGKKIIEFVISNAKLSNKYVKLRVAWYNYPAKHLYEKIGFVETVDYSVYCEMECR